MTIKDILVAVDHLSDCNHPLDASNRVAELFDAHQTALHVNEVPGFEAYGEAMTPGIIEAILKQQQVHTKHAKLDFERSLGGRLDKSSFVSVQGHTPTEIVRFACSQDLVIVGQSDPHLFTDPIGNIPERVALESGRPTLVVPYIGCRDTLGQNILIAWNNKREAVRAVHDAMPLLVQAKSVKVLAVNTGSEDGVFCGDIGEHLARHNVNVEVQQLENTEIKIANSLLSHAADFNSDLLVMGAYGHSRLREYTLGGVTRTILKTMTIPVLLSH